jgi:hypothetical protein
MSNDQNHTTDETEPMRATRRTVLRGAGIAGLLTMGVGTASAQRGRQAQQQSAARGRGKGPQLPPQAAQRARDIIDLKFPGGRGPGRGRGRPSNPDNGNGDNDNGNGDNDNGNGDNDNGFGG